MLRDTVSVNRARVLSRSGVSFEKRSFLLIIDLVEQNIFQIFSISKKRLGRSIDYSRNCSRNTSDIERNSYRQVRVYSSRIFSVKRFQTIPPRQLSPSIARIDHITEKLQCAFYLVISACIAKLKDCGSLLRVEIQDPGIQDAKLERRWPPSSRPPRGSERVRDSSGARHAG